MHVFVARRWAGRMLGSPGQSQVQGYDCVAQSVPSDPTDG